jgi:hypothetical protein
MNEYRLARMRELPPKIEELSDSERPPVTLQRFAISE